MNQYYNDIITKNFVKLMKNCNVEVLKKPLIDKRVFKENEINQIFSSDDARHNKRLFFFAVQKKENGWNPFIEALKETNQTSIVDILLRKGPTVFNPIMNSPDTDDPLPDLSNLNIPVNNTTKPLKVDVIYSDKFYDTYEHNGNIDFYKSRCKKRGRVLVINNYQFINDKDHPYRNGAIVDDENLKALFQQMGGWDLDFHQNKTALEMDMIIQNFANHEDNHLYDICFIIIMSHGSEEINDTIIYGIDGTLKQNYLFVSKIEKLFSNENCKGWRTKPKIMLFPVCRGGDIQYPLKYEQRTESDSLFTNSQATNTRCLMSIRADEDMLIGYSTVLGYKSHRDYNRGSWYIELLCQELMTNAYKYSINDIMLLIDQGLRRRMSENHTMQTAEFRNRGFKRLYLHPGLYFEKDIVKKYENNHT